MAKYKSKYPELGFYVKDERKQFMNGNYTTEKKAEIDVLDNLTDVEKVEEEKAEPKPKAQPKKSGSKAKK
ncbi:hypothetical protein SAMN05216389_1215 [Oceanobacillus limi]|uniref:Uncharacterized protein n=1 Tax=Oceanobacillus limi TaxID=930131 RepID=A0A1I0GE30_9BACI|nr:hypothetical protein [Oceanobacillus limi]SET69097.1 hypothetical protein SAMN05216389_1215 [Oceanobacillus limi]